MTWLRILLFPLSLIYGFILHIRNLLFDWRILPSTTYDVQIISVGNLSMGGAGKTPHVEFLIRLLQKKRKIAVLSRGYRRKTRGFIEAETNTLVQDIGDEVAQLKRKFPEVIVAVHEKRRKGISRIMNSHPETDLIILDDAFQHRYVNPGLNLLLTEYYKPFFDNFLLPSGSLRESRSGVKRADALIVTKTPAVFSPLDERYFLQKLSPYQVKRIFFSTLQYLPLVPLWDSPPTVASISYKTIFLLTGIANIASISEHLKNQCQELFNYSFPDHHQFRVGDLEKIRNHYRTTISQSKVIITTEKDFMRLQNQDFKKFFRGIPVYYLPIEVRFHPKDQKKFEAFIYSYLKNN
jgi:tetraacyldisaccharide 4'-kinase